MHSSSIDESRASTMHAAHEHTQRTGRPCSAARSALAFALASLLCACQSAGGPPLSEIAAEINATLASDDRWLGVGDVLTVRFPHEPTWDQVVEIDSEGGATFLAVGTLRAAGETLADLSADLTRLYTGVFDDHDLSVVRTSRSPRTVHVMGEFPESGEFALTPDRRLTLLDAFARAGGPRKESAYLAQTLLVRWDASAQVQRVWTIDAREEHWKGAQPLYLQPYDFVYVPNTPVDDVAIWVDNFIRRMLPFPYIVPPIR